MLARVRTGIVVVVLLLLGPVTGVRAQSTVDAINQEIERLNAERHTESATASSVVGEVQRERTFQARTRTVFQRYNISPDAFQEAFWAYRLAVYERLESGDLTWIQARALITEYGARITAERDRLRLLERQAVVDAAMRALYWSRMSQSMNAISQAMQQYQLQQQQQEQLRQFDRQRPIFCNTQYVGNMAHTSCH